MAEAQVGTEMRKVEMATRRTLLAIGLLIGSLLAMAAIGTSSASAKAELLGFEVDRSSAQAGGHPNIHAKLVFRTKNKEIQEAQEDPKKTFDECYCVDPKQFTIHLPTGFIGNPHAVPKCTLAQLGLYRCPPDAQVGLTSALFGQQLLYNMEPRPGEPGLLASQIPLLGTPVFTILRSRTDSDYGLDATTPDIFHLLGLEQLELWLWGVPTEQANDKYRAPTGELFQKGCFKTYPEPCFESPVEATAPPAPYLQNPTSCQGPISSSLDAIYYNHETVHGDDTWGGTTGCDLLAFNPALIAQPTTHAADTPSGLDVIARVPQQQSPTVPSASELKELVVTLPEGVSINPNAADGKAACTDAESAIGTLEAATCPQSSKVGLLTIDSSALPAPIEGALYLGEPKPGERYRLILAADGFETHVKLAGTVELDAASGRVVTRFEDLPQSPLQEFDLHIFGAERGLLAMPERCGTYTVGSEFVPWSGIAPVISSDSFTVAEGPNGSDCPGQTRPLDPKLVAGSPDNTAGAFSPLALRIDRPDGDQNLAGVRIVTPPGFLASLRGVEYCPEQAIDQLRDPGYTGLSELASNACPAASRVGDAMTSSGAGSRPVTTPGAVYLAGPYKGAPVSLVVVIPAVSGPYDLGNVAVRVATNVDPDTAQITATSDPLPQILDGVPLRVRSIFVNLERPGFALNPTNCRPSSIDATLFGDEGGSATASAFYQVANCAVMAFGPQLSLSLRGSTKRRSHPAIHAVLQTQPGESNLAATTVSMPKTLILDNARIGNVCTRAQFAADACPADSVLGSATADTPLLDQPISGPVFLRSSDSGLPDLVADLRGQIDIELVAHISSTKAGGLRTRFSDIPDAPVSRFVIDLQGGSRGLLSSSENLCRGLGRAFVSIWGQNGMRTRGRSRLRTPCASAARRSRKRHRKHRRHKRSTRVLRAEMVR
jgi:hypothetical protein